MQGFLFSLPMPVAALDTRLVPVPAAS